MAQSQVSAKKQQGIVMSLLASLGHTLLTIWAELQQQYTTYKTNLQQLAERIGNVESETEEHKYVITSSCGLVPTINAQFIYSTTFLSHRQWYAYCLSAH